MVDFWQSEWVQFLSIDKSSNEYDIIIVSLLGIIRNCDAYSVGRCQNIGNGGSVRFQKLAVLLYWNGISPLRLNFEKIITLMFKRERRERRDRVKVSLATKFGSVTATADTRVTAHFELSAVHYIRIISKEVIAIVAMPRDDRVSLSNGLVAGASTDVQLEQTGANIFAALIAHTPSACPLAGRRDGCLLQPRVSKNFLNGVSSLSIGVEHFRDEILCTFWDSDWLWVLSNFHLVHELFEVGIIKWHCGCKHGVKNHAKTPRITFWTKVGFSVQNFGWGVKWTATVCSHHRTCVCFLWETEICQFGLIFVIEENVFKFEISVCDTIL